PRGRTTKGSSIHDAFQSPVKQKNRNAEIAEDTEKHRESPRPQRSLRFISYHPFFCHHFFCLSSCVCLCIPQGQTSLCSLCPLWLNSFRSLVRTEVHTTRPPEGGTPTYSETLMAIGWSIEACPSNSIEARTTMFASWPVVASPAA